jgi:peroxiredoxin
MKSKLSNYLNFVLILLFSSNLFAQKDYTKPLNNVHLTINLSVDKDSCLVDTLRLFAWTGIQVEEIEKAAGQLNKSGNLVFSFMRKNLPLGNYYIGRIVNNTMTDMRPVLLGMESKVEISGRCADLKTLKFTDSKVNLAFDQMIDSVKSQSNQFYSLLTAYQENAANAKAQSDIKKSLSEIDFKRKELYNNIKKEYPDLAQIAALFTYQSFQNNQKTPQQTEGQYIAESYFQFANLKDTNYLRSPFFYEAVKGYVSNLNQVGLSAEQLEGYFDKLLSDIGEGALHYKPAILAVSFGVMNSNAKLFVKYGTSYLKFYKGYNVNLDAVIEQRIAQLKSSTEVGDEAPDFSAATPDGKTLSLKSLRGKVLLVDFWASWCGPCRRENPNVVAVYNKYKSKGFDVLGVSLDNDGQRWKGAIDQDKLTWHHVSDLGGWGSMPAKLYKVTGIPHTLLLDKNGIIIAKNLRGQALEQKLIEIFGE